MVISPAHAPPATSESLGAALAATGRSAPTWLLAALATLGSIATTAIVVTARSHWALALPFSLAAAFGAWGLTEQGRDAVTRTQSLDATTRYVVSGVLHAAGILIIAAGAIVSTILVFAITFFLAGAAPNL